jgi:Holliday junction resolvase RusA-like endonuclease
MLTPDVGALFIEVHAFMPRPKSHYRTNKGVSVLRIDAPLYHTSRPDADNILKAVKDALSGVCWIDDAQVSYAVIRKTYGNEPKMIITFGALIAMSAWWG